MAELTQSLVVHDQWLMQKKARMMWKESKERGGMGWS